MSDQESREFVESFASKQFSSRGLVVDVAIHEKKKLPRNPHVHMLMTTRPLLQDGTFGKKDRSMNKRPYLKYVRDKWFDELNLWYQFKGIDKVVSAKSFKQQGLDRKPTKHVGPIETRLYSINGTIGKTMKENEIVKERNFQRKMEQRATEQRAKEQMPAPRI